MIMEMFSYIFAKDAEAASNNKATKHAEIETEYEAIWCVILCDNDYITRDGWISLSKEINKQ